VPLATNITRMIKLRSIWMGHAVCMEKKKSESSFGGKTRRRETLTRLRHRWNGNLTMGFEEVE
jgi:hypothetical protein